MDRRAWLTGAVALAATPALAAGEASAEKLFADGPLSRNRVAAGFKTAPPGLRLPPTSLLDARGRPHRLAELRGRPAVLTLWSETCTPCLAEAPDLARLGVRYGAQVRVLGVLTGSLGKLDQPRARAVLDRVHAHDLSTWVEPAGGARVLRALAGTPAQPDGFEPCTLLLDRAGRMVGRSFGYRPADNDAATRLFKTFRKNAAGAFDKDDMARLQGLPSVWSTPDADSFLQALASGALDRAPV